MDGSAYARQRPPICKSYSPMCSRSLQQFLPHTLWIVSAMQNAHGALVAPSIATTCPRSLRPEGSPISSITRRSAAEQAASIGLVQLWAHATALVAAPHGIKHLAHAAFVTIIPMTAVAFSAAPSTSVSSMTLQGRLSGGSDEASCGSMAGGAASTSGLCPQAIAQLVESVAVAHLIRHCPHGGLLPISAITADVMSAAVPTFVTSAIVHAGAGTGAFGAAVVGDGAAVVGVAVAHAIAQLVESFAVAHPIRHFPHAGELPIRAITADVLSSEVTTDISCSCVHGLEMAARRIGIGVRALSTPGGFQPRQPSDRSRVFSARSVTTSAFKRAFSDCSSSQLAVADESTTKRQSSRTRVVGKTPICAVEAD